MTVIPFSLSTTGSIVGLLFSSGVLLVAWRINALRPRLLARVERYLREPSPKHTVSRDDTPFPNLERLLQPILKDFSQIVHRFGSHSHTLQQRLQRAGYVYGVEQFRVEQMLWSVIALGGGLVSSIALASTRNSPLLALALFCVGSALCGALGRDYILSRQIRERERAMNTEFPTIAELLALAVGAGETPLSAVERVVSITSGALTEELSQTLRDVRSGVPLPVALSSMANRTQVPAISRFTDGVSTAIERGTPLAQVLRSQAEDAREGEHQMLMEIGGKKEITMMIPVVFLLLPITVVFALFPGLHMLSLS